MNIDDETYPFKKEESLEERKKTFTRRQLLQTGWTVPVIVAIEIGTPKTVFAQGGSHFDYLDHTDHTDHIDQNHADFHEDKNTGHYDTHIDEHKDSGHTDHSDHTDTHQDGHSDIHDDAFNDNHKDSHGDHTDLHNDRHKDYHEDAPHSDVNSHDDHLDHIDS